MEPHRNRRAVQSAGARHRQVRELQHHALRRAARRLDLRAVHVIIVVNVRPVVAARISAGRPDIIRVGRAKYFDETVVEVRFAIRDTPLEAVRVVRLSPQQLRAGIGVIEDRHGIFQRLVRPLVDLIEVRFPRGNGAGIDIEGHDLPREPERVAAAVREIDLLLDQSEGFGNVRQLANVPALDLLDARVVRIRIDVRQHRVRHDPVEQGALPGAARPFAESPDAIRVAVRLGLPWP
jgi:hypothetical protein